MLTEAFDALDKSKKDTIIEAATRQFETLPYEKVSMFKIAQQAGVSRTSLYYYFKDKADIYHYITDRMIRPFFKQVRNEPPLDPFTFAYDFFVFFAAYKGSDYEALLRQALYNAKSIDIESKLKEHLNDIGQKKAFRDLKSLIDLSSLKDLSDDEVIGLFILLQTVSSRLLLEYINGEITMKKALSKLDRVFDLLRYGFVRYS